MQVTTKLEETLNGTADTLEAVPALQEKAADMQDALNQLMDMLETTVTQDDLLGLQDELRGSLEEALAEGAAANNEAVNKVHDRIETTASDLLKQVEAVGREAETEELRLQGEIDGVKQAQTVHEEHSKAQLDHAVATSRATEEQLVERLVKMEEGMVQSLKREIDGRMVSVDSSLSTLGNEVNIATGRVETKLTNATDRINARLTSTLEMLDTKIKTIVESMEDKLRSSIDGTSLCWRSVHLYKLVLVACVLNVWYRHRHSFRTSPEPAVGAGEQPGRAHG